MGRRKHERQRQRNAGDRNNTQPDRGYRTPTQAPDPEKPATTAAPPAPASEPSPKAPATPLENLTAIESRIAEVMRGMKPSYILFARRLAEGVHQDQAAIDAGYSVTSAKSQGCRMAADAAVVELKDLLMLFAVLTDAHISKPALAKALFDVIQNASAADRVAAVRAAMRLQGFDRVKVEMTGGAAVIDGDALRKDLADRLARQLSKEAK